MRSASWSFVTAALSAAVWLAQSLRLVDLIVNRGLSIEVFLYLALLILPRFLDIVLPIGAFIAVLFVFNRLTSESELVVMRGAGWAVRAGQPGLDPGRHRLCRADEPVRLFPAGLEPRRSRICSSRSATASSRRCCRRARSRRSRQADDLYRRPRRARRSHRPADQRQPRSAAAGHDHRRARRLRR